jgi:hypothetical protein
MLLHPRFATNGDVVRLLGEIDPLTTARILEIGPSVDELDEAIRAEEDEAAFAEEPHTPSSLRVANVRAVLADLARTELEEEPR